MIARVGSVTGESQQKREAIPPLFFFKIIIIFLAIAV
jgi:hypothetical protein